jgi:hypothetical protein
MKEKLSVSPSIEVDQKILEMASKKLVAKDNAFTWSALLKPSLVLAGSALLITIINIKSHKQNDMEKLVMTEPAEMVLNYSNIELMADAGSLSEDDWKKIGITEVTR